MAFALAHFYQENAWDIIPCSDIVLDDEQKEKEALEGTRTLVLWRDVKSKGKVNKQFKFPAEIVKISGLFSVCLLPQSQLFFICCIMCSDIQFTVITVALHFS